MKKRFLALGRLKKRGKREEKKKTQKQKKNQNKKKAKRENYKRFDLEKRGTSRRGGRRKRNSSVQGGQWADQKKRDNDAGEADKTEEQRPTLRKKGVGCFRKEKCSCPQGGKRIEG